MAKRTWLGETGPFPWIWFGQTTSMLGSGLSGFGIGVWVFQQNQSVTQFALIAFFVSLPQLVLSPLVGALVDRWDRRLTLILSDAGSGICVLAVGALAWTDLLQTWHIYMCLALASVFAAFNWPAMSAATTLIVPRRHLSRAAGLNQVGTALTQISSPIVAGILVVRIGLSGLIAIDVVTFLVAVSILAAVRIPKPPKSAEGEASRGSLASEATFGWRYIRSRHGLLALLLVIAVVNFSVGIVMSLFTPLVLSFASPEVLGVVLAVAGSGMLTGSLLMSVWAPSKRIYAILGALSIQGLILFLGGLTPNAVLVAGAGFVFLFLFPVVVSNSQAIWQSKVPPDIQGRVFAMRRLLAASMTPLAYLTAGPLADHVFEPLMAPGGALAGSVGLVIGVGKGRGIGLLLILMGVLILLAVAAGGRYRRLLRVEEELPDAATDPEDSEKGSAPEGFVADAAPEDSVVDAAGAK